MDQRLACLDGAVMPEGEARLPVTDEGLLRGDGVFEVIRLYGGVPFALDDHLARMDRSAAGLRLELDTADVRADIDTLLAAARPGDGLVRVLVTRGGHRVTLLEDLHEPPDTTALGIVEYTPTRVLDGIKSLSYAANRLASRLAIERGFDEALLVTPHGRVLEGPTSSFFCVIEGELVTPPLGEHVLDSITRRRVRAATGAAERILARDDIARMTGAFLASTIREVQPVSRIEDHELDPSDPVVMDAARRTADLIVAEVARGPAPAAP
jgi:branched-chain amino acid aminotransferase